MKRLFLLPILIILGCLLYHERKTESTMIVNQSGSKGVIVDTLSNVNADIYLNADFVVEPSKHSKNSVYAHLNELFPFLKLKKLKVVSDDKWVFVFKHRACTRFGEDYVTDDRYLLMAVDSLRINDTIPLDSAKILYYLYMNQRFQLALDVASELDGYVIVKDELENALRGYVSLQGVLRSSVIDIDSTPFSVQIDFKANRKYVGEKSIEISDMILPDVFEYLLNE